MYSLGLKVMLIYGFPLVATKMCDCVL